MEQHPVPQNITGFQFKLVGDMTLKQFIYLAVGILSAYIIFQFEIPSVIKWLLATIFGLSGFAFAFVPIEERPLDRWLASFFKSIYAPTQFLWKKNAPPPEILTMATQAGSAVSAQPQEVIKKKGEAAKLEEFLLTLPTAPIGEIDQKEEAFLNRALSYFAPNINYEPKNLPEQKEPPIVTPPPQPKKEEVVQVATAKPKSEEEFKKKTEELTNKISSLQQELNAQTISKEKFIEAQAQLSKLLEEKERQTKELVELKRIFASEPSPAVVRPSVAALAPEEPRVKTISAEVAPKMGIPSMPAFPNAISGIVKTHKGTILPGIIVEIKNQAGVPVRALKTNKLGQFAVSTPLPNGTYTLHLEDSQGVYRFDIIEVVAKGEEIAPLEILAKTEKDVLRENLTKKLFGS